MRFLEKHFSYTRCFDFLITYVQHFKVKKIKLGAILFLGGKLYPPIYGFLLSKNRGMKHKKNFINFFWMRFYLSMNFSERLLCQGKKEKISCSCFCKKAAVCLHDDVK